MYSQDVHFEERLWLVPLQNLVSLSHPKQLPNREEGDKSLSQWEKNSFKQKQHAFTFNVQINMKTRLLCLKT